MSAWGVSRCCRLSWLRQGQARKHSQLQCDSTMRGPDALQKPASLLQARQERPRHSLESPSSPVSQVHHAVEKFCQLACLWVARCVGDDQPHSYALLCAYWLCQGILRAVASRASAPDEKSWHVCARHVKPSAVQQAACRMSGTLKALPKFGWLITKLSSFLHASQGSVEIACFEAPNSSKPACWLCPWGPLISRPSCWLQPPCLSLYMQTTKDDSGQRQAAFERDMQAVGQPARRSSGGQKGARRRNRWSEEETKLLSSLVSKARCAAASCCHHAAPSELLWLAAQSN